MNIDWLWPARDPHTPSPPAKSAGDAPAAPFSGLLESLGQKELPEQASNKLPKQALVEPQAEPPPQAHVPARERPVQPLLHPSPQPPQTAKLQSQVQHTGQHPIQHPVGHHAQPLDHSPGQQGEEAQLPGLRSAAAASAGVPVAAPAMSGALNGTGAPAIDGAAESPALPVWPATPAVKGTDMASPPSSSSHAHEAPDALQWPASKRPGSTEVAVSGGSGRLTVAAAAPDGETDSNSAAGPAPAMRAVVNPARGVRQEAAASTVVEQIESANRFLSAADPMVMDGQPRNTPAADGVRPGIKAESIPESGSAQVVAGRRLESLHGGPDSTTAHAAMSAGAHSPSSTLHAQADASNADARGVAMLKSGSRTERPAVSPDQVRVGGMDLVSDDAAGKPSGEAGASGAQTNVPPRMGASGAASKPDEHPSPAAVVPTSADGLEINQATSPDRPVDRPVDRAAAHSVPQAQHAVTSINSAQAGGRVAATDTLVTMGSASGPNRLDADAPVKPQSATPGALTEPEEPAAFGVMAPEPQIPVVASVSAEGARAASGQEAVAPGKPATTSALQAAGNPTPASTASLSAASAPASETANAATGTQATETPAAGTEFASLSAEAGESDASSPPARAAAERASAPFLPSAGWTPVGETGLSPKGMDASGPGSAHRPVPLEQLGHHALATIRQLGEQQSEARLQLHPAELGSLDLELRQDGQRLELQVTVDNENTRRLIQDQMASWRERLAESGMRLASLDVEVRDHSQRQESGADSGRATEVADEAVNNPAVKPIRVSNGALDFYA